MLDPTVLIALIKELPEYELKQGLLEIGIIHNSFLSVTLQKREIEKSNG